MLVRHKKFMYLMDVIANLIQGSSNFNFAPALPNAAGTVYRGDLYFANGNVGIGIASASPTTDVPLPLGSGISG